MDKVNFFTPVTFGNLPKTAYENSIERYDSYFNITGWSARVIDKDTMEAEWHYEEPKLLSTVLKIISYATVIIPLIVLTLKWAFRANLRVTFKKEAPEPDKIKESVLNLLNQNKFDDAKNLIKSRNEDFAVDLKKKIEKAEDKYTLLKNIKEGNVDAVQPILEKMDTSLEKDDLLGKMIDALLKTDPERALLINNLSYQDAEVQLQHKFNIVSALIEKGADYQKHLSSLPKSSKKDRLLQLALENAIKNVNSAALDLFKEPFQDSKLRAQLIRKSFAMLTDSNAADILAIFKMPANHVWDEIRLVDCSAASSPPVAVNLAKEFMQSLCEIKSFEAAKGLLDLKSISIHTRMTLYGSLASALIKADRIDEGIELIRKVLPVLAAKEAVIEVIKVLKEKELYGDFVDLILEDTSLYQEEYMAAFTGKEGSELYNRFVIAETLLEKGHLKTLIKLIDPVLSKDLLLAEGYLRDLICDLAGKDHYEEAFYYMGSYEFWNPREFLELLRIFAGKLDIGFNPKSKTLELDLRRAIFKKLENTELEDAAKKIYPF